jgi:hypothetical protein
MVPGCCEPLISRSCGRKDRALAYRFGLVGSITRDLTTSEDGLRFEGLGGILYHAATLGGLGQKVRLLANAGEAVYPPLEDLASRWPELDISRVERVPGPGNRVHLHYPRKGERREILRSAVPALNSGQIIPCLKDLDFLLFVASSGMDIPLTEWRAVLPSCSCPVWFDVHSLVLSPVVGRRRFYRAFPQWMDWLKGSAYVQSNRIEAACMLSHPRKEPAGAELSGLARTILQEGSRAVFLTLGREGVLTATSGREDILSPEHPGRAVDTTGCGDVFAAATSYRLAHGDDPFAAAAFGLELASKAASVEGVDKTYDMARRMGRQCLDPA